jgi:hypothetical protein
MQVLNKKLDPGIPIYVVSSIFPPDLESSVNVYIIYPPQAGTFKVKKSLAC